MGNGIVNVVVGLFLVLGHSYAEGKSREFKVPSFMGAEQNLSESEINQFRGVPFFEKTDISRLYISGFGKRKEGVYANLISKDKVNYGGYLYPSGVQVSGENDLLRIYMKGSITINGIKICGQLGQHAQTLEVFEITLCNDSEINGVKIPGGSKVAFIPHKSKKDQRWLDISCITPGKDMNYRGTAFKKGERIVALSKNFRPENQEYKMAECEVLVWDRERIETLKKIGIIK